MINNVMAKYADVKKGLYDTQYEISGKPPTQDTNTTEEPRQAISLIDLDDAPAPSSTGSGSPASSSANILNDLSDIFGSSATISNSLPPPQQQQQKSTNDIFDLLGGGSSQPSTVVPQITNSTTNFGIASPSLHNTSIPQINQTPSPVFNNNQVSHKQESGTIRTNLNRNRLLTIEKMNCSYFGK